MEETIINTTVGNVGHLFVILAFVAALVAAFAFFKSTISNSLTQQEQWIKNGRAAFAVHAFAVFGIVATLFYIIYNHMFEYHYAWSHSSTRLPVHYMISSFWEGQEGSFLLWMFWHAVLGIVIIITNKFWEASVMAIFSLVQAFLTSMIMGVVIGESFKIGSSPFILLRDAMDAPIFQQQPNFIPEDGTGLNPLLQNYWMVIHPPTLFLGFALTVVPFAYAMAGLWQKKYREWVRPALPWALFGAAVLGLGILMGGYWAYETLNFGGYWNWDPVENAVYVPWLFMIAGIHTMISFKKSETALKASLILVVLMYILILYSTFLTRSGILGEASVHSFTDLGLSGQLLIYLLFFTFLAVALIIFRWKELPTSEKEASTYSREFWLFIGALMLCLMGFQVIFSTSFPVINAIVELFGGVSNLAPLDPEEYSSAQLWFAAGVAFLSAIGQFFWWKKMKKGELWKELISPIVITLILTVFVMVVGDIDQFSYIILLLAAIFTIVANAKILWSVWKTSPKLSGGAITHIGVGLVLIGILFSSGYSKVVSLNNSGLLISREMSDEFNRENLLLFLNETRQMNNYEIEYKGERLEPEDGPGYIPMSKIDRISPFVVVATEDIFHEGEKIYSVRDTIRVHPENVYYEVELRDASGKVHRLYPRIQDNPQMGLAPSPSIKRDLTKDLYAHVVLRMDKEEVEWTEPEEFRVKKGEIFYVNDYVTELLEIVRVEQVRGTTLEAGDVAVKARIEVQGPAENYIAEPVFIIKDNIAGRVPDEVPGLGIRFTLMNIHPQTEEFTISAITRQKDWIILKAMEKPLINILWLGTLVLMVGFGMATVRRYDEFRKMRKKGME
jgi:cytochrome c-type biogenesis protein CcmF